MRSGCVEASPVDNEQEEECNEKKCLFRKDVVKGAYNIRKTEEKKGQNLNDQMRRHEHFWATIDPS
jgi:hypothetical protein